MPYFLARHRAGDRLRIMHWRFNSRRARDAEGGFELTLRRRAPGYRGGRSFTLHGKGAGTFEAQAQADRLAAAGEVGDDTEWQAAAR